MRRFFTAIIAILATAVSCSDKETDNNGKVAGDIGLKGVSFKKVDLSGAQTLALASVKAVKSKADGDVVSILYIVDENGILKEVQYTIEVSFQDETPDNNEEILTQLISTNLKIAMEYVFSIGDKWLWLYNCRYYYPEIESVENDVVRNTLQKIIDDFGEQHSFLVRRTDGALFSWDDSSRPWVDFERKSIFGLAEAIGENIYTNSGGTLYGIFDNGNVLDVKSLLNTSIRVVSPIVSVPGENAILFIPGHVMDWVALFLDNNKMSLISNSGLGRESMVVPTGSSAYRLNYNYPKGLDGGNARQSNFSLILQNDGRTIPMCCLYVKFSDDENGYVYGAFCSHITLDADDTVTLMWKDQTVKTSPQEDDPWCLCLSKNGLDSFSLPAGTYDFCLRLDKGGTMFEKADALGGSYIDLISLYVDDVSRRVHQTEPLVQVQKISVNSADKTAAWEPAFSFLGLLPYEDFEGGESSYAWTHNFNMSGYQGVDHTTYTALLELDKGRFSSTVVALPEGFPLDAEAYIDGKAYVLSSNNSFYICDLATLEKEEVIIDYSALDFTVFGGISFTFDRSIMAFCGSTMTLEGDLVQIVVDLTGENRGIARVYTTPSQGAGETITQLIRLN